MKNTLVVLILFFGFKAFSQPFDIEWGELERQNGRLRDVMARNSEDFFALRWSGGLLLGKLKATHHENLKMTANEALQLKAQGSMASYEGSAIVGNRFVVFLSDKKHGENKFFMTEYNDDVTPSGDAIELASYSIDGKRGRFQGDFSVVTSRGRDFFAVVWSIPGKKTEEPFYGYKVFDKELNLVTEGEYEMPFEQQFMSRNGYYLSNTGDLFLTVTEYEKNTDKKRVFRNYKDFVATHILHISENGLEDMVIDLKGKRVEAMTFSSDNSKIFTIAGTYGEKDKSGVKGMFYLKADFKNQNILAEGFEEFGADFITQDWSDRQKNKMEKKKAKGKDVEPALYSYVMRQLEVLPDGSMVGSMEQYYVVVTTYTDPKTGATRTTYTYYYNDIVTFRVGEDGGFDWLNKIDKFQVSTNDGGYFSSYERFVSNGKLYFIFNDNAANYDESGVFIEDEKISSSKVSKRKNIVGLVEIDLESGDLSRESFFKRADLGAVAVPKLFNVDYISGEVLLYAIMGKKEKFGVMKIGE